MGNVIFVSSTEPSLVKKLGIVSSFPEEQGADILCKVQGGFIGIQRKEIKDLVSSLQDGRLAYQLLQSKSSSVLAHFVLIIEGKLSFTNYGELLSGGLTKSQLTSLTITLQQNNTVLFSSDLSDTVELILNIHKYFSKESHNSLYRRPKMKAAWGRATNRDFGIYLLQSIPGVGLQIASDIYDYFGGLPLSWDCSEEELLEIPGVGPHTVARLLDVFSA